MKNSWLKFNKIENVKSSAISGKIFVFTGSLNKLTRSEAVSLIEGFGAKSSSTVSKKTDYVVAGDNAGSKLTNAQKLNVPIISEDDFLNFFNS